jgi:hypothetical protein
LAFFASRVLVITFVLAGTEFLTSLVNFGVVFEVSVCTTEYKDGSDVFFRGMYTGRDTMKGA